MILGSTVVPVFMLQIFKKNSGLSIVIRVQAFEDVQCNTVSPLLSAVLGRTKFWSQKPRIIEVRG